ncbi:MAG: chorismate mutase [Candidatus Gastranaerophilales bacterium]|nr:chorismate mutase [Candidatus Gastranaerophilales bacterium]
MIKGIRGAITVEGNSSKAIEEATLELLGEMIFKNKIEKDLISHVVFTLTEDLNAEFPAKFAREKLNWNDVAMLCFHELNVPNSLEMCLRVLIVLNCDETFSPEFVYLKGASELRK